MTLIDTAEMYGEGASESLIGEAIGGARGELFLVTRELDAIFPAPRGPRALEML